MKSKKAISIIALILIALMVLSLVVTVVPTRRVYADAQEETVWCEARGAQQRDPFSGSLICHEE